MMNTGSEDGRGRSKFAAIATAVALAAASMASPVSAQSIPPGSYQGTCANINVQRLVGGGGRNLEADCQNRRGVYMHTFLALPCRGDIQNKNGRLVCVAGNNPFAPPRGSYQAMCRNIELMGPILKARCTSAIRVTKTSTINTLDCRGRDIRVRLDGRLDC